MHPAQGGGESGLRIGTLREEEEGAECCSIAFGRSRRCRGRRKDIAASSECIPLREEERAVCASEPSGRRKRAPNAVPSLSEDHGDAEGGGRTSPRLLNASRSGRRRERSAHRNPQGGGRGRRMLFHRFRKITAMPREEEGHRRVF